MVSRAFALVRLVNKILGRASQRLFYFFKSISYLVWVSVAAKLNPRGLQGIVQLFFHMKDEMNVKWNINLTQVH